MSETSLAESPEDRLAREREYHDQRFAEETRTSQEKYYSALKACFETYESLVTTKSRDAVVLEYGCATGGRSIELAPSAKKIHGIDISQVAIDQATATAKDAGLTNTDFQVMNAEAMEFEADTFDLIFGSGIIHHLEVETAYRELHRTLKPGGAAVFVEPLGCNPLINLYRQATPGARTVDEHPLTPKDFEIAQSIFSNVDAKFYGLTTLAAVPLRNSNLFGPVYGALSQVDALLLSIPGIRYQGWFSLITAQK